MLNNEIVQELVTRGYVAHSTTTTINGTSVPCVMVEISEGLGASFYPDKFGDMSVDEICDEILNIMDTNVDSQTSAIDFANHVQEDGEWVKDHLRVTFMNQARSDGYVRRDGLLADIDEILCVNDGDMFVLIRENQLKAFESVTGLNVDQMFNRAIANMEDDVVLKPMSQIIRDIMGEDEFLVEMMEADDNMFVLMNSSGTQGAAAFATVSAKKLIKERIGKNVFIIPSSRHELIIIRDDGNTRPEDLNSMVNEVNVSCVDDRDYLADRVSEVTL